VHIPLYFTFAITLLCYSSVASSRIVEVDPCVRHLHLGVQRTRGGQVMINSTIRRMRLSLGRQLHSPRKRFIKAMRGPRPSIHGGMFEATVCMPRRKVQNKTMRRSA
jgi:hypothetical protein